MTHHPIFSVADGCVSEGVTVDSFTIKSAQVTLPAILIGEEGRGREMGVLPVHLSAESYRTWQQDGRVRVLSASVGQSRSGRPKLFEGPNPDPSRAIVVAREPIGFRGWNRYSGRGTEYRLRLEGGDLLGGKEAATKILEEAGYSEDAARLRVTEVDLDTVFRGGPYRLSGDPNARIKALGGMVFCEAFVQEPVPFPGQVLVEGRIAQGAAGRMGSGTQKVFVVKDGDEWVVEYGGRRYGAPHKRIYRFENGKVISLTPEEVDLLDDLK